ncbi:hypothetical protein MXB_3315 [Myxobolus squamalis]|nr:hypothetical protein MXB_3315 [Myxobolus squamalis]
MRLDSAFNMNSFNQQVKYDAQPFHYEINTKNFQTMNTCMEAVNAGILPLYCILESDQDNYTDLSQRGNLANLLDSNIARHDSFINDLTHQEEVKIVSQKATEYIRNYYSPKIALKYNSHARMTSLGEIEYNEFYSPSTSELSHDMSSYLREKVNNYCSNSSEQSSQATAYLSDQSSPTSMAYTSDLSLQQNSRMFASTIPQNLPNMIDFSAPNAQEFYYSTEESIVEGSYNQNVEPPYQGASLQPIQPQRVADHSAVIVNQPLDPEALARKIKHNNMEKERRKLVALALDNLSNLLTFNGNKKPSKTCILIKARHHVRQLENEFQISRQKNNKLVFRRNQLIQAYLSYFRRSFIS